MTVWPAIAAPRISVLTCEVANGQERVRHCVGYRDHLRRGMNAPYPVDPACEALLELKRAAKYSQHLQELKAAHTDDIPF